MTNDESVGWGQDELRSLGHAHELHIAAQRTDGTLRTPVPIWVVTVDGDVYVRTWYRRDSGWYGTAVRSQRAHIRVSGADRDVAVTDVGSGPPPLKRAVDAAYRAKYGRLGAARMVGDRAAATTLRLSVVPR